MFSVADCPGLSVAGNDTPDMLNPVPVREPELIVSAAVPVELIVTDCVAVVFSATVPNATLVDPIVHAAEVAFSCSEVALLTPPALAVIVAAVVVLTAEAVAVNAAVVAPAGTVTEPGTVTAELLLASDIVNPPLGAAAVSVTEQASVTAPVSEPLLQETPLSAACGFNCRDVALLTPPALAVIVAVVVVLTAEAVAVNAALVAPAATVTEPGTVTAELLLASDTASPPLGAAAVSVTLHASEPAPVSEPLLQLTALSAAGATAVPLRLIVAVPAAELLLTVTVPVLLPAAVGSYDTFSTALCPGLSVTGAVNPDAENPVPLTPIALIVSAAVPVEDSVTACVVAVFTLTLPNARLVVLSCNPPAAGFSCTLKLALVLHPCACSVAVCVLLTAEAVAAKLALFAPCGTVTDEGTCSAVLLLDRLTDWPPLLFTVLLSVTVQVSVAAPVSDALAQESPFTLAWFLGAARSATGASSRMAATTANLAANFGRTCPKRRSCVEEGSAAEEREGASLTATERPKGGGNTKESIYLPRSARTHLHCPRAQTFCGHGSPFQHKWNSSASG